MKTFGMALTVAMTMAAAGAAQASEWEIDPSHTTAQFSVKHMMFTTVRGTFDKVSGIVNLDDKDPTKSSVEFTMDAASVNTREPKRDAHLRSPDFFDAEKNPKITFKSTKIQKAGKNKYKVTGDLTMRGVTKPATLNVDGPTAEMKNPWGQPVRSFTATTSLNRKDWGLNWNKALEAGGVLVSDQVQIEVSGALGPKAPPAAAAK
jgi:polyisoprenoid-binding protein YceI